MEARCMRSSTATRKTWKPTSAASGSCFATRPPRGEAANAIATTNVATNTIIIVGGRVKWSQPAAAAPPVSPIQAAARSDVIAVSRRTRDRSRPARTPDQKIAPGKPAPDDECEGDEQKAQNRG